MQFSLRPQLQYAAMLLLNFCPVIPFTHIHTHNPNSFSFFSDLKNHPIHDSKTVIRSEPCILWSMHPLVYIRQCHFHEQLSNTHISVVYCKLIVIADIELQCTLWPNSLPLAAYIIGIWTDIDANCNLICGACRHTILLCYVRILY